MEQEQTTTATDSSSKRTRKASSKTRKTTRKRTAPPKVVNPSWVHEMIASSFLNFLSAQTAAKVGTPLRVGETTTDPDTPLAHEVDGREPVELLARIIAHIMHRIPLVNRVEKKLEGADTKSGLGADVLAFLAQMWQRNRDLGPTFAEAAQASRQQAAQSPPEYVQPVTDVTGATGNGVVTHQQEV